MDWRGYVQNFTIQIHDKNLSIAWSVEMTNSPGLVTLALHRWEPQSTLLQWLVLLSSLCKLSWLGLGDKLRSIWAKAPMLSLSHWTINNYCFSSPSRCPSIGCWLKHSCFPYYVKILCEVRWIQQELAVTVWLHCNCFIWMV